MSRLSALVAGRRTKWVVVALWAVLAVVMSGKASGLTDKIDDSVDSQIPGSAESTEVFHIEREKFASGETLTGLVVYQRDGGLTEADKERINEDVEKARGAIPQASRRAPIVSPFDPAAPPGVVSDDGTLAYYLVTIEHDFKKGADFGEDLRDALGSGEQKNGLNVYVTGSLGLFADFTEVFDAIDGKLLGATVVLVLVLLFAIYRSVVLPFIPILVVGVAYQVAKGFVSIYADSGATVTGDVSSVLPVLMFGVGTDYCLLLVARYREELHRFEDKHDAMHRALARSGPAIIASGITVILGMLVLVVAEVGGTAALGPSSAIAVAAALLAGITLLPALLTICGRAGFFPRKRLVAYDPSTEVAAPHGPWRAVSSRVLRRPGAALFLTVVIFGAGALGLLAYKVDYSTTNVFKKPTESVDGLHALEKALPAGSVDPTSVLVVGRDGATPAERDVTAVEDAVRDLEGVADVERSSLPSVDGSVTALNVVLAQDPYSEAAINSIPAMRETVKAAEGQSEALVGGGTATQHDFDRANDLDLKRIVPLALLVVAIILGILLRAVVAPIVLIASVLLSFLGTLGLSILFFTQVAGSPGIDGGLPTEGFIFLVALGVDYTIFLMSRVREEAKTHGTREGMLRALTATGPVITSAGIILAGTFAVLMTLPVTFAFNIGFLVALGILLDTFVVRTIMVPAAVELLGDKVWWPSTPQGGKLREDPRECKEARREAIATRGGSDQRLR